MTTADNPNNLEAINKAIAELQQRIATLSPDELPAALTQLNKLLEKKTALVRDGIVVQGDDNEVVGARGAKADDVGGSIVTGDHNKVVEGPYYEHYHEAAPGEAVDSNALRTHYLGRVLQETSALPLAGIDRVDAQETAAAEDAKTLLPLHTVYTALLTTDFDSGAMTHLPDASRTAVPGMLGQRERGAKGRPISALTQLDTHNRLVLLGDPGSGKSTFVNFVAACHAGDLLDHEDVNLALLTQPLPDDDGNDQEKSQPWQHGPLLPLRIILRDLAAASLPPPDEPASADHLWNYLGEHGHTPGFMPFLKEIFQQNGGLLLLDGLDEVPEAQKRRAQILQLVADLRATLPLVRILVTSRPYAYRQQDWQLTDFNVALLAPFTAGQVHRFIDRWYAFSAAARGWTETKAAQDASQLQQTIADRAELQDLAERPLLLTLMTSLHAWRGGTLPGKRALLYDETVDLLLNRWENLRLVKDPVTGRPLQKSLAEVLKVGPEALRRLLEKLAYEAHASQPDAEQDQPVDLPEETVISALLSLSRREDLQPRLLAAYLRDRAGLLVDRGGGVYTFPHRTFQEFLAACFAADRNRIEELTAAARLDPSRWREVLLLSVAHASKNYAGVVWDYVPYLCREEPDPPPPDLTVDNETWLAETELWGAHLAGMILLEVESEPAYLVHTVGPRDRPVLNRLRQRLVIALGDERLPATERAQVAVSLGVLGDTRQSVLDVDAMRFCYVPPGPFEMGTDDLPHDDDPDFQAVLDSAKPAHSVDLAIPYWLAQYPVTNAQFQMFVAAGGYQEPEHWKLAEANGLWQDGQIQSYSWIAEKSEYDRVTRGEPYDYGRPFNLPNHPIVGVNWYEAQAFCHWLTRRWWQQGRLPNDWQVRLPTEAEWEKGLRGGQEIPEKPKISSVRADMALMPSVLLRSGTLPEPEALTEQTNFSRTKIGASSGVGCFPAGASPYGCEEMLGTVWEWTQSAFGRFDSEKSKGRWVYDPFYDYPYRPEDGREQLERDTNWLRVLRGGSWAADEKWTRCGARLRFNPNLDLRDLGFRVLMSPFIDSAL